MQTQKAPRAKEALKEAAQEFNEFRSGCWSGDLEPCTDPRCKDGCMSEKVKRWEKALN